MRSVLSVCLSVCHSVCEQDNSRTRLRMSTKSGRHGHWWPSRTKLARIRMCIYTYDRFSTSLNIILKKKLYITRYGLIRLSLVKPSTHWRQSWIQHGRLCWKSTVAETGNKVDCCRIRSTLLPIRSTLLPVCTGLLRASPLFSATAAVLEEFESALPEHI